MWGQERPAPSQGPNNGGLLCPADAQTLKRTRVSDRTPVLRHTPLPIVRLVFRPHAAPERTKPLYRRLQYFGSKSTSSPVWKALPRRQHEYIALSPEPRSEERRVGKEGRCRGS